MRMLSLAVAVLCTACGYNSGTYRTDGGTAGAAAGPDTAGVPAADAVHCATDNGGLTLAPGFCAWVAHDGVGRARHIAVTPDGRVYVALREPGGGGSIVGLRDTNGDGRLDEETRFGEEGGTGIAVRDGWLYFAPNTHVVRYRLGDGLAPAAGPEMVVSGFPQQRGHAAKTITFDNAGRLYVNVGGPSNACQAADRQHGSPGQDPCPELQRQTGIWRFDLARVPQTQADGERYATGIRNAVALDWHRGADALFVVQHGRDMLDVIAPEDFDAAANAELPAEEFLRVGRGDDFGHPYCYYDHHQNRRVLAPEYGGDGTDVGRCDRYVDPVAVYPAHWAPNDLLFYDGSQFPARFRGGSFVAWHGSWNRAPQVQRGYKVTFRAMQNGRPAAEYEVIADGFTGRDVVRAPNEAAHRPMGLAQAPDGSLYVVDSVRGRIWRIVWRG
jgi:glucose/arabinose dehydrogenase